jgi:signal transduction histidine kinase
VQKNGNTLEVQYASALGTMVADRTRLKQVLLNLLSNAAKFTKEGAITFCVAREARSEVKGMSRVGGEFPSRNSTLDLSSTSYTSTNGHPLDWVIFTIADTGIGMTPEQMDKVFQPFVQADNSTTREYGGTGLGLAISQRFCEMMEGKIIVESQMGIGSTFTLLLPGVVSDPKAAQAQN